jgi:hypothetical protein
MLRWEVLPSNLELSVEIFILREIWDTILRVALIEAGEFQA